MVDLVPTFNIACVSSRAYGYTKRDAGRRLPTMKGRPRYRLRDAWASYVMTVEFDFTPAQYQEFQEFWYGDLNAGLGSFIIGLSLDDPDFYNDQAEQYVAHATGGFNSSYNSYGLWNVTMPIEIAGGFRTNIAACPIIYGGPIDALAPDTIYGGPIDALAGDVIVPCPGVDPNGN